MELSKINGILEKRFSEQTDAPRSYSTRSLKMTQYLNLENKNIKLNKEISMSQRKIKSSQSSKIVDMRR